MNCNQVSCCLLLFVLTGLSGCSSGPSGTESKKTWTAPDKVQGKAQVLDESTVTDATINAGGPAVYLWDGLHRYRLFFKTAVPVVHGNEYVAEGVNAQKAIDEIGDPDQGKNGYPLPLSCERAVKMAWSGLSFDELDSKVAALRAKVKRYPARTVFLVTRLQPVTKENAGNSAEPKKSAEGDDENIPEVSVAADKQRAFLIEGSNVQTAPLWEPAGGTVRCKIAINTKGKVSELVTGIQLCEAVPWSQFSYQPPVERGHPVKVKTEVEVRFEPRK